MMVMVSFRTLQFDRLPSCQFPYDLGGSMFSGSFYDELLWIEVSKRMEAFYQGETKIMVDFLIKGKLGLVLMLNS